MRHTRGAAVIAPIAVFATLLATTPALAGSDVVHNPGPITLTAGAGSSIYVDSHSYALTGSASLKGRIAKSGAITVPKSGITFPPFMVSTPFGTVNITVVPQANATGNLNPSTGLMTLGDTFNFVFSGSTTPPIPSGCHLGPVAIHLTTQTSGSLHGTAYSQSTGSVTVVDGLFAVPGASNCGAFWGSFINGYLSLPSPSGQNGITLAGSISPIIH